MISFDQFEKIASSMPFSTEDIFKLLNLEDNLTVEIYGNYEKFKKDQNTEGTLLYKLIEFTKACTLADKKFYGWVIVCKKGYIKYWKDCFDYFIEYYSKRSDLNFLTRLKMSLLKTKRWVGRVRYSVDMFHYIIFPENYNKKIKKLFDNKEIDRIYIYKTQDQFLLNKIRFEEKHKR